MPTQRPSRLERNHKSTGSSNEKPKKKKKKISAKKVMWSSFFTVTIAIICGIIGYLFIMYNGEKLLAENQDKLVAYGSTKVYDRGGNLMGELSIEKSEPVESDQIPELLKNAFIATEDRRFRDHGGVDIWSIGRAAVKDVVARSMVEGGSTITQQLAKNIFLSRDKTFFRKATEVSIAMALERKMTKDQIITMYLNRINFGGTTYGVKAAAIKYFGKSDLKTLEVWEMATLAAMPKGPSKYNPLRHPEASMTRRAVVLDLMYQEGYITAAERDHAKKVKYNYQPPVKKQNYMAFMDYVMDEVEDVAPQLTEDQIVRGGYKIYTTMDAKAQKAVEKAFANDDLFEKSKDGQEVQGSIVIMNHENGAIMALLGGRDYERKGYSRIYSRRQPGSALKPIVDYAPALETGKFGPDSRLSNKKQCFGNYCPKNLHGYSDTIGMTEAITKSENIPAVWTLNQIGVDTGVEYAKKMGIKLEPTDNNLAIALGGLTKGTNTMEMAEAYSVLANQGKHNEPYAIKSIEDHSGSVVYEHGDPKQEQILSPETAYHMTQMLQNVVTDGTGKKARIDRPVAGKTGTTQHGIKGLRSSKNRDVWFVGYTPEWTAAIWMGYDKPDKKHLLNGSSGQTAAMFAEVMKEALKGVPVKDFKAPADLSKSKPDPKPEQPAGVTGLSGTYDENTATVSLAWNGVDKPGVEYRIYRKSSTNANFGLLMSVTTTDAEDLSVVPGTSYEYYVTYYDSETGEESQHSNSISIKVPEEVTPPDNSTIPEPGGNEQGGNNSVDPGENGDPGSSDPGGQNNQGNGDTDTGNNTGNNNTGGENNSGTDTPTGNTDPGGNQGTGTDTGNSGNTGKNNSKGTNGTDTQGSPTGASGNDQEMIPDTSNPGGSHNAG